MKTYMFALPVVEEGYHRLLKTSLQMATFAGLVQGSPTRTPSNIEFMSDARAFLVREELVLDYPGGIGHFPRRRFLYTYNAEFVALLESTTSGLFDWARPTLPEDLHLLRRDESTVLGTLRSERHAYLRLEDHEAAFWQLDWPDSIALQE